MTMRLTLSQRLSIGFAALLLACCALSAWVQVWMNGRHEQEVVQRLSAPLAGQIAGSTELMRPEGLDPRAVRDLFDKLMAVNPSVEVYLLDLEGRVKAHAAPPGHLRRGQVDVAPIRRLLAGAPMPVLGDDPRNPSGRQVFSAAPLRVDGRDAGYVYVVLLGEDHQTLSAGLAADNVLRTTLWSLLAVSVLGLVVGLAGLRYVTRPLRRLAAAVDTFRTEGMGSLDRVVASLPPVTRDDEVSRLVDAFGRMARQIATQWRELTAQDQQRRELFANISHDLRTPLTSLHGYLETLLLKADTLTPEERRRYLDIALGQSRKVGRLAQELFELARLEYGVVTPDREPFALADLVQDVFQKFELAAGSRRQRLVADIAPGLPGVNADLGMIERVLTNLLDNAIRHTPDGGEVRVALSHAEGSVVVEVSDTGPGIPESLRDTLFKRPAFSGGSGRGGLGLLIVQRILQLHGSEVRLAEGGPGATFRFRLG